MRPYKLGHHCCFNINYHIVFCPKRRKPILTNDLREDLIKIFYEIARQIDINIENLEIMADHIHMFVSAKPTIAPHSIIKRLKGASSKIIREKYSHITNKLPALWSSSYYIGSVGSVSESVIKMYIDNQKGK
jgi:putative transposase